MSRGRSFLSLMGGSGRSGEEGIYAPHFRPVAHLFEFVVRLLQTPLFSPVWRQYPPFVTYQEAARLTGKTVRTIRRKIKDGVIAESQTQRENGHVTIAVAELERVFGKLRRPGADMSEDTDGHGRTAVRDMSGTATDVLREYLDFTKQQLEWEQRRNDRLERALEEMRDEIKRTQEQLSRLLPIVKPPRTDTTEPADTSGHGRTKRGQAGGQKAGGNFGKGENKRFFTP